MGPPIVTVDAVTPRESVDERQLSKGRGLFVERLWCEAERVSGGVKCAGSGVNESNRSCSGVSR